MKKLVFLSVLLMLGLGGCSLPQLNLNFLKNDKMTVISEDEARGEAARFINDYLVDAENQVTLGKLEEMSGLYKMEVNLANGQQVDGYMTKDAKYFFTDGIDMAETKTAKDAAKTAKVEIQVLQAGTGDQTTKTGDNISVNYKGTLADGTVFDSSYERGEAISITLGQNQVILGWEQGLLDMKIGEKRQLIIPPSLAYGDQGYGEVIPPNATLTFEVELMSIN